MEKKKKKAKPKKKSKPDFSQSALAAVEKLIGGKLSDGIGKPRSKG